MGRFTDPRVVACALGVLLLIAVWATTLVIVRAGYGNAHQKAAATTRELVQTYEAHALRALREIDHTLRTVKYSYDLVGETDALARLGARGLLPPEMLFEVGIANDRGIVVSSTHSNRAADVSHEDFFVRVRAQEELFIAQPKRGKAPNEWRLLFSRRLDRSDGSFAGAVFIAADAAFFVSNYDAHALGAQGLLALVGTDQVVRVRRVGDAVSSGQTLDWAKVMAHADSTEPAVATAEFDGVTRYLSSRQLSGFPLAVMVGLSRDEQLAVVGADTRKHVIAAALVSALLMSVVVALGRMSWKLVNIRAREQQTRLSAARESGMAEIATNVLHNVGNALNSVNVSATLVCDGIRQSKVSGLTRAVALMREHEGGLGEFLAHDARGKHLPGYLHQLASTLQADQASSIAHLDALQGSVEHIRKIVMMQQMLAKASAVREEVDFIDLMEASLQMNVDALGRHGVNVIREFQQVPTLALDKHGVLQILVNLISNAKHACSESGRSDKLITLRVQRTASCIELSVQDNGVGIPAENLTRVFQHGFTTRATGHGFGLHSSALAARELGGSLQAQSEGLGLGATFTLRIPVEAAQSIS